MQTDKDFWENPEEFIPDRFADVDDTKNKPFFPFGMGIRRCVGKNDYINI